ncbi:lytic transglycosylase domain-containing protein [Rhizobium sp. YTU87027]|uniref:lytic transglycosylase domain-containing protein n=1 Tax=Rhizobium sp. YTU87027 TaxID=3417741 RepID=UPI003D681294
MTSKFQASIIAATAWLHSATTEAQSTKNDGKSIISWLSHNGAIPQPRLVSPGAAAVKIKGEAILLPRQPVAGTAQDVDYFSSYLSGRSDHQRRARSLEEQTKSVRKDESLVSTSPPPCGPSPASVEDIKALAVDSAGRHGVDPDFALAVVWTESRFDQLRNSPKGARGPMQLMPETARRFNVTDVCDPADNIDGGMRYLRALLDEFKSPIIAAAAYNAGEQAVYNSGGLPAYPETVRYVASVINHQLGLAFPVKRKGRSRNQITDIDTPRASHILGAPTPTFVGGVMKFPTERRLP